MKREDNEIQRTFCPHCRKLVPETDFCIFCGNNLVEKTIETETKSLSRIKCPNCEKLVPKTEYCIFCGKKIDQSIVASSPTSLDILETSNCPLCRQEIPENHNFCHFCGAKVKKSSVEDQKQRFFCNRCWKPNPSNIDYCIHCGLKQKVTKSRFLETPFEGYQMDLSQFFHPNSYTFSSFKQSGFLSSSNFPAKSTIIHSNYFGVHTYRKKTMNKVYRNFGGFDLTNLINYSMSFGLMIFIYYFWYSERYSHLSSKTDIISGFFFTFLFGGFLMTTLLMAPIWISTFFVYRNTGFRLNYRLESSRVFTTIIFNIIWMLFPGFGPIFLRLGEFKDVKERIVVNKSFIKGIAIGSIIAIFFSLFLAVLSTLTVGIPGEFTGTILLDSPIRGHIITSYLGSIWISIILLLPLGDYYDKVIKQWNQVVYIILLSIGLILLLHSFNLMSSLTQLG